MLKKNGYIIACLVFKNAVSKKSVLTLVSFCNIAMRVSDKTCWQKIIEADHRST